MHIKLGDVRLFLITLLLSLLWFRGGFSGIYLDTDLGRDLAELSNLWQHHVVWLGPRLSIGFPASPLYYYLFLPALWLAGGNANGILMANGALAAGALLWFGWLCLKKYGQKALIGTTVLGLLPCWLIAAPHPGNGYTYLFWLFLGLTSLWFEFPLLIASGLIGIAIAHHPAAMCVLPILAFEWWRRGHTFRSLLWILHGLIVPWAPIIVFEFITKGYLIRQWLVQPASGMHLQLQLENIQNIFGLVGSTLAIGCVGWLAVGQLAPKRLKFWFGLASVPLLLFGGVSLIPIHYLLGMASTVAFIIVITLLHKKWGGLVLALLAVVLFLHLWVSGPLPPAPRSIPKMAAIVEELVATQQLSATDQIAVVAALSAKTEVPQADDYRFFLRMKGYHVLDVQQYAQANTLVMFIEQPDFAWQTWSNWEIEQAGARSQRFLTTIDGVTVIIWEKAE